MKLVYENNPDVEVTVGDIVSTFRDEQVIIKYVTKPHKPSSTGRVGVQFVTDHPGNTQEYFPGVINAKWIEREDQPWNN
jgi:hypothetical protein